MDFEKNIGTGVETTETPDTLTKEQKDIVENAAEDNSMAELEALIAKLPSEEELTLKRIYGPSGKFDDSGLKAIEEMIKSLPTRAEIEKKADEASLEATKRQTELAANILLNKWKREKEAADVRAEKGDIKSNTLDAIRDLNADDEGIVNKLNTLKTYIDQIKDLADTSGPGTGINTSLQGVRASMLRDEIKAEANTLIDAKLAEVKDIAKKEGPGEGISASLRGVHASMIVDELTKMKEAFEKM